MDVNIDDAHHKKEGEYRHSAGTQPSNMNYLCVVLYVQFVPGFSMSTVTWEIWY